MPRAKQREITGEVVLALIRGLGVVLFAVATYFMSQLNGSISDLTKQLRVMEIHQIEADKRIATIETSREINMQSYTKLLSDVQDMKTTMIQNTMRTQTISDFISSNFKPGRKP